MKLSATAFALLALCARLIPAEVTRSGPSGNGLQNVVQWDSHSLFINGERKMIWSGEYHPFRLPSPGLWLDVFQKIKAMGYSAVSFYLDWALLEGKQGNFRAEGVLAVEPFMEAAATAGIYLIARTGPYINSESSGGGLPGWLQRCPDVLRSDGPQYMNPALNYTAHVSQLLAPYQITKGGPLILWQVENEYTAGTLYPDYMAALEQTARDNGIVVPTTHNDAWAAGNWIDGQGAVDVYGSDGYPFGYGASCVNPYNWPSGLIPNGVIDYNTHMQQNPDKPFGIMEFEGGNPVGWGGADPSLCGEQFNAEWERLFYKNMQANSVSIFNVYMTYGGTNWGGIGFPGGVTTYDQYSVIAEDRQVTREKYSEAKLEATFLQASSAYLTSIPNFNPTASLSSSDLSLSTLEDTASLTQFLVVRHADYTSYDDTPYTITTNTSRGQLTIPQLNKASLTLQGRDSKIHLVDYAVGNHSFIYSTLELFSWAPSSTNTVAILYGAPGETHEFAVDTSLGKPQITGTGATTQVINNMTVVQWKVSRTPTAVKFGNNLNVYLYPRSWAYNLWAVPVGSNGRVIVDGGYLIRNATINGNQLDLVGDINATTSFRVLAAPPGVHRVSFNGKPLDHGIMGTVVYQAPQVSLPDLTKLAWKYHDSLPEVSSSYDDSMWTICNQTSTNSNTPLRQKYSPYAGDYGYHVGALVYRGHFTSAGNETGIRLIPQGGLGFSMSVWLDDTFLGSYAGQSDRDWYDQTFPFSNQTSGSDHVITVIVDNMGLEMNWQTGGEAMKTPRGIVEYHLLGRSTEDITWRITGNLGGEDYYDQMRGPLNEGGLFAERQGWHLPGAPTQDWKSLSPLTGVTAPGVSMFTAVFDLNLPTGYDIPLSFNFDNASNGQSGNYRFQLFVNGYWMGRYVHNLGPQNSYPVPEGVLNYRGQNQVSILLWAQDSQGAALDTLSLQADAVVQTGYGTIPAVPQPQWTQRQGAY